MKDVNSHDTEINNSNNFNLSEDEIKLCNFIPDDARVLIAHPKSYNFLNYLIAEKGVDLFVLDIPIENASKVYDIGGVYLQGDINKIVELVPQKKFDLIVMDESLLFYGDVSGALKKATSLASYCLVTLRNLSTAKERLKFLLTGKIPKINNDFAWYNEPFYHSCTSQEFIDMCISKNFTIERACFYDKKMNLNTIYSIIKLPTLFTDKFYFILRD